LTPTTLYAGTNGGGIFRSVDSGDHWTMLNTGLDFLGAYSLAIDPLTPTTLYASTEMGVLRSVNGVATWGAVADTGLKGVQCLAIDPINPTTLYAGARYGVFRSTNSGEYWTLVNTGLAKSQVSCLAIDPKTPTTLYAGTWGAGVFRSMDGGDHWTAVNTGLTNTEVHSLAIDPHTPGTIYAGSSGTGTGPEPTGDIFRSTDGGDHWMVVKTGIAKVYCLAIDPLTPTTLYAGIWGSGAFRTTDSGTTWTAVSTGLMNHDVYTLAISPHTPTTLYAGTWDGLFRSMDSGDHWTAMNTGLTNRRIRSLAIDPLTPTTLYAITGLDVFRYGVVSASKSVIQLKIGSRTMYVDGSPVALEAAPIILNSRTLLPIRAIVEATGGTIAWEASTRKVTIVRKDKTLELWIGKNVATLNGKSVNIDTDSRVVPIIRSGRTLLPLRFVTEALALDVQWNATTQAITITYTP
ncbi:stalk domain-containing protein, partial [Candidatus Cryosericum septentrionale]